MAIDRSAPSGTRPRAAVHISRHSPAARSPTACACWTVEHHAVPLVSFLALLPVGASSRSGGRPGLAAITGDMLDEGSRRPRRHRDARERSARIGAQLDTDIGSDATIADARRAWRASPTAASRCSPTWSSVRGCDQRDFDRVRELRLNRLMQLRDMPPALADRAFTQLLYRDPSVRPPADRHRGVAARDARSTT